MVAPYLHEVRLDEDASFDPKRFPFALPFVKDLRLKLDGAVTFFVGENGSGKSTLLEAIAVLARLPIYGGSSNEMAARLGPEEQSELATILRPAFRPRHRDGYFFRAELQANFASLLDARGRDPAFAEKGAYSLYGGQSLHTRSHGEAFLSVMQNRFRKGLFLLDEPEAALSPQRQLSLLALVYDRSRKNRAQFIVATHSPILLTYPDAKIVSFDEGPLATVELEDTSHYQITQGILRNPDVYWRHLKGEDD